MMHVLTKSEFMKMVINDRYKKLYKQRAKEREFPEAMRESIFRCVKESGKLHPKVSGQR